MKMAAATALAGLAKEPVPDEVRAATPGQEFEFGPDYIIPTPFDPRLITTLPPLIAKAAMDSGTATSPIDDFDAYKKELSQLLSQPATPASTAPEKPVEGANVVVV